MSDAIDGLWAYYRYELKILAACKRLTNLVTRPRMPVPDMDGFRSFEEWRDGSGGTKEWVDFAEAIQEAREVHETLTAKHGIPPEQMHAIYEAIRHVPANHPEKLIVSIGEYHDPLATIIVDMVVKSTKERVSIALAEESDEEGYESLKMAAPTFLSVDDLGRLEAEFKREISIAIADVRRTSVQSEGGNSGADHQESSVGANKLSLFPEGKPDDTDLCDLVVELDSERAKPKEERRSMNQTARDFFGESGKDWKETKARKYIARTSTGRKRGKINLDWPKD